MARPTNEHGLTPQEERFAQLVACGKNQTDALREAYPSSTKWKQETAYAKASQIAARDKVKARIASLQSAVAKEVVLDRALVIREIAMLAQSDIRGIVDDKGRLKLPHELDEMTAKSVASFSIDADGKVTYKFWDKNAALEKAAKHLGLYEIDNKQKADALSSLLDRTGGNVVGVADDGS